MNKVILCVSMVLVVMLFTWAKWSGCFNGLVCVSADKVALLIQWTGWFAYFSGQCAFGCLNLTGWFSVQVD